MIGLKPFSACSWVSWYVTLIPDWLLSISSVLDSRSKYDTIPSKSSSHSSKAEGIVMIGSGLTKIVDSSE